MNGPLYAGIDVGGTAVKWMIVDENGRVVDTGSAATSPEEIVEQVRAVGADLSTRSPSINGFGVICPGVIDEAEGRVVYAANLDLDDVRLADVVADATGTPTALMHDGRAAGLAEGLLGAGRGAESFIMMPIGTGISVALMLGGSLWAGHTFCAGEVGHSPVFPGGETCTCGQRGCLEVYASAKGLARRYGRAVGRDAGAREVERLKDEDPVAAEVWDTAVEALAVSLTQLTLAIDPARIIIGGGLSHAGDTLLLPLRARVASMLAWREPPEIVSAGLAGKAGAWGAAILAAESSGSTCYERWTP